MEEGVVFFDISLEIWVQIIIAVIAFLALLRPEITNLITKFWTNIDFYPAGLLEIGFFDFGPTIGLSGTIKATGGNRFISSMDIKLIRLRDNATYNYPWAVFRKFNLAAPNNFHIDIASAFSLLSDESKPFNIQFHDIATRDRFKNPLLSLQKSFQEYLNSQNINLSTLGPADIIRVHENFRNDTTNNNLVLNAYSAMGREFYWESGKYRLELIIKTDRPHKEFTRTFHFLLSEEEVDELDINRVGLTQTAMSYPFIPKFINTKFL